MFKKKVTLKILFLLIFSDILETFIQFCFKKSSLTEFGFAINKLQDVIVFLTSVFSSAYLWFGLAAGIAVFILWSGILSKIDLSVAVPIASFSYVLVPLASIIFLGEKVTVLRWLGIFSILVGVIFVSLSSKERLVEPQ